MIHFLGIGAQKAGTTWLHEQLKRHPGVFLPEPKELHFWNRHRAAGLDWYQGIFAGAAAAGARCGEITPAYGILPVPVIEEVRAAFPDLALFYAMRNPVERAWSSALMALGRAELEVDEASDQWFIDHFLSRGSRARGDYETCLRNWWSVFGRERVQTVLFDDIVAEPRAVLARLAAHLGIDPAPLAAIGDSALRAKVNEGSGAAIRPQLRAFLSEFYRPKVERLSALLGRDLGAWLD